MPQTMMTALEDTAANMINSERENVRWNSKIMHERITKHRITEIRFLSNPKKTFG
jgi:hypothetical protein